LAFDVNLTLAACCVFVLRHLQVHVVTGHISMRKVLLLLG
jgi:hypothetical protein